MEKVKVDKLECRFAALFQLMRCSKSLVISLRLQFFLLVLSCSTGMSGCALSCSLGELGVWE